MVFLLAGYNRSAECSLPHPHLRIAEILFLRLEEARGLRPSEELTRHRRWCIRLRPSPFIHLDADFLLTYFGDEGEVRILSFL